ncbi:MAG: peptidoglycan D,D-transpeptidase FtsI family protein, partial [Candidatus Limnocylindrales bacterium]
MPGRTDSRRRLLVVLLVFVLAGGGLVVRLAWWQVAQQPMLAARAQAQTLTQVTIPSRRGTIYDRSGTVVLATTVDRYMLEANPNLLGGDAAARTTLVSDLVGIIGLDPSDAALFSQKLNSNRAYVILAHGLEQATADRVQAAINADGAADALDLATEATRVEPQVGGAPNTSLAAQLLGFVNRDGAGQYGVEQYYQAVLAGQPKVVLAARSITGRPLVDSAQVVDPGTPGQDITLTIDDNLQLAVEQEVMAAAVADSALSVSAVVIDPKTGEVYAEASYPSYDANAYATTSPADFVDPVVSDAYEPGSVFKMLTALAALQAGTITPTSIVDDSGSLSLDHGTARIYDSDKKPMGKIPFEDVLAYSRNVGAARVALGLAASTNAAAGVLKATWDKLGIGRPTGIDVAGEAAGTVHDPTIQPWHQVDLANAAFGQGVAVTLIQLATVYSAMVNGGTLVTPHVVAAIGNQPLPATPGSQVIAPTIAATLTNLMSYVVHTVPWYRAKTLVKGYTVGGKTGTAQIWDPTLNHGHGGWMTTRYNNTFVGYIGRNAPDLVIAVQIHEGKPLVIRQGDLPLAVESYELFRRIATDSMTMLDLTPTSPASPASTAGSGSPASPNP